MKKIKKVLHKLRNDTSQKLNKKTKEYEYCYTSKQAKKDIKKIILDMIGEDIPIPEFPVGPYGGGKANGYNQRGAEIRKKVLA